MSTRIKWLLVVFTLLGAILGLAITLRVGIPIFKQADALWQIKLIFAVATALYGLGVIASLWFARNTARRGLLRFYYWLQIVALSAPFMDYQFVSGAHLTPSLGLSLTDTPVVFGLSFWFGSIWEFQLLGESAWSLGINLVAVAILWLLRSRVSAPPQATTATPTPTDTIFAPLT